MNKLTKKQKEMLAELDKTLDKKQPHKKSFFDKVKDAF